MAQFRALALAHQSPLGLAQLFRYIQDTLKEFLLNNFDTSDTKLSISELKVKYEEDIKQMDEDWWTFNKVSEQFDYKIFFAHAEEIGYKRGANKIEVRPNELFNEKKYDDYREIEINQDDPKTIIDHLLKNISW